MCCSENDRIVLPVPYRVLDGFSADGVELHTDWFVISKEACRESDFDCSVDLLLWYWEDVIGVVVDDFVHERRPKLGCGRHLNCGDFGLKELTDICIVPVLPVSLVVINVELALGMSGTFYFRNLLVELYFRPSTLDLRGWSW